MTKEISTPQESVKNALRVHRKFFRPLLLPQSTNPIRSPGARSTNHHHFEHRSSAAWCKYAATGYDDSRRIGNLPHRGRRLTHAHSGIRVTDLVYALAFDASGTIAGGHGEPGTHLCHQQRRRFHRLAQSQRHTSHRIRQIRERRPVRFQQQSRKNIFLGGSPETEGTYESDVFDAQIFSRWGRAETRTTRRCRIVCPQRQCRQSRPQLEPVDESRLAERCST